MKITTLISILLFTSIVCVAQKAQLIINPQGHTGLVNQVIFKDKGRELISVGNDKCIRIWDVNTAEMKKAYFPQQSIGFHGRIYAAALSSDEQYLAFAGFMGKQGADDKKIGEIHLMPLNQPEKSITLLHHRNIVTDLLITQHNQLISGGADGTVAVWDLNKATSDNKPIRIINAHDVPIVKLAYASKSAQIATADNKGNVKVWNLQDGKLTTDKIGKFHDGAITALHFSENEQFLYSGGEDGKLIKWTAHGRFLETVSEEKSKINAILQQGKYLIALDKNGKIRLQSDGQLVGTFNAHNNTVSAITAAPFSNFADESGTYVATAGGDEKEIIIWRVEDGQPMRKLASKGKSVFAVSQIGNANQIAFGQSNPTDILEDAPFEKYIDFDEFQLFPILEKLKTTGPKREYLGQKLYKESAYSLQYGYGKLVVDKEKDGEIRAYTFLDNAEIIAVATTFGISLFKRSGALIQRLVGHDGEVWAVAPLLNDYLISGSADQTFRIWNFRTGELLFNFFPATDGEWIVWSPSSYYHASAGGEKYIGWLVNSDKALASYFPVSDFRAQFHRPDMIRTIWEEGSLQKAAKKLNIKLIEEEKIEDLLPPSVQWQSPVNINEISQNKTFTINASITSNNPLKEVKLMINGRPVASMENMNAQKTGSNTQISYSINFDDYGKKSRGFEVVKAEDVKDKESKKQLDIQLFVKNEVATHLSEIRTVSYEEGKNRDSVNTDKSEIKEEEKKEDIAALPKMYLISIGISSFQNPQYNLNVAHKDAEAISELFKDQEGKLYSKVINHTMLNEKASRAKILTVFENLKKVVKPTDFVMIFIATHGLNVDNQFYILPYDGNGNNPKVSCVSWSDFADIVGNLPSQVLLMVDACHSGQLGSNIGHIKPNNTEAIRKMGSDEYGVVLMAASTGSQYSLEHPDWGHGAFTLAVIEGLRDRFADIRPDGIIYLREIDFFVSERVKDLTGNQQNPTTQKPSSISAMPLIKFDPKK